MEIRSHKIDVPDGVNVIVGQAHFIKTAEDIYEALVNSVPGIKFGFAFCESSGPRLVRHEGTDEELRKLASKNAYSVGAGHSFIIYISGSYPINVLNAIKTIPEVCNIYCASANPVELIVAQTDQGRGIIGVVDGGSPNGIESEKDVAERRSFLRKIGYKLAP
ncbi:MAG TPA: adenosine-specific kinase [Nitrososphaerales archaeon]|nr:adenosine-specific kinase [Nitrososphaerales archaeon]